MVVAVFLLIGLVFAFFLMLHILFKDKELIPRDELKELKHEHTIMDQALREAFLNPDQAQLYINNAFEEIRIKKQKEIN